MAIHSENLIAASKTCKDCHFIKNGQAGDFLLCLLRIQMIFLYSLFPIVILKLWNRRDSLNYGLVFFLFKPCTSLQSHVPARLIENVLVLSEASV